MGEGGLRSNIEGLEGEPLLKELQKVHTANTLPDWMRPLISGVLYLLGEKRMPFMAKAIRRAGLSAREYWYYCKELQVYQEAWVEMLHAQDLGFCVQGWRCQLSPIPCPNPWSVPVAILSF